MKATFGTTALGACLIVAGCTQPGSGPKPTPESIPVTEVINQLKIELAAFKADTEGAQVQCGSSIGQLNMAVSNVQVELSTTLATTDTGNVSATIPVSIVTVGPSLGASLAYNNVETISLNFTPSDISGPIPPNSNQLNVTNALKALRNQIVAVSPNGQCLGFTPKKDQTIKLAFSAARDLSGGLKLTILVLTLGATLESKTTNASTLTVGLSFTGAGGGQPPPISPPRR